MVGAVRDVGAVAVESTAATKSAGYLKKKNSKKRTQEQ
jgi:hypothetical protein